MMMTTIMMTALENVSKAKNKIIDRKYIKETYRQT